MSLNRTLIALGAACVLSFSMHTALAENTPTPKTDIANAAHAMTEKKVDINTATLEELKQIKGVGASKAKAIMDYRVEHGPFKTVEELSAVKGFSAKVVASLVKKNPGVMTVNS
jgi:competence protein ComEA